MPPRILVLMPTYNAAGYLRESVGSILSQSFDDFQLLVVDDGSTDNTSEVLAEYDDPRLRVISQENHGLVASINLGIAIAEDAGVPFLARMDADDISEARRLEKQIGRLEKHPSAAACSSNASYVNDAGETIGDSTVPIRAQTIKWELEHNLRGMIHGATLFRTEALTRIGGCRSAFPHAEDVDLFLRLSEHGTLTNCPDYLYRIRLNLNSMSVANSRRNSLYGLWAVDCARRRRVSAAELSFEEYGAKLDLRSRVFLKREGLILSLWRAGMRRPGPWRYVAALIDPRRSYARLLRKWEAYHERGESTEE